LVGDETADLRVRKRPGENRASCEVTRAIVVIAGRETHTFGIAAGISTGCG
jgi:hypothetical protein